MVVEKGENLRTILRFLTWMIELGKIPEAEDDIIGGEGLDN